MLTTLVAGAKAFMLAAIPAYTQQKPTLQESLQGLSPESLKDIGFRPHLDDPVSKEIPTGLVRVRLLGMDWYGGISAGPEAQSESIPHD